MQRLLFRQCDSNYPFLWEDGARQMSQRWNQTGSEPTQYFSDTPEGAWAEFLRHEEIIEPLSAEEFTRDFNRVLWAVEVDITDADSEITTVSNTDISYDNLIGDASTHLVCQQFAKFKREAGFRWLIAPSAALVPDAPIGLLVREGRLQPGPIRENKVFVHFGQLPKAVGWRCGLHPFCDQFSLKKIRRLSSVTVS